MPQYFISPDGIRDGAFSAGGEESRHITRAARKRAGDEIEIYVWGDERLQRVMKVLPDGSVSFPLVGRIDALNKLMVKRQRGKPEAMVAT